MNPIEPHLPESRIVPCGGEGFEELTVCVACTGQSAHLVEWPCRQADPGALAAYGL